MDRRGLPKGGRAMKVIATLPAEDRRMLFTETGARIGLPPFHVEKDFWVCWALSVLLHPDS